MKLRAASKAIKWALAYTSEAAQEPQTAKPVPQLRIEHMSLLRFGSPLLVVLFALLLVSAPVSAQEDFSRGDCNLDDQINIADAVLSLSILFSGAGPALCPDACDVNDDGNTDISDPVSLLSVLFSNAGPPPPPISCGQDPTADGLGCPTTSSNCQNTGCGPNGSACDDGDPCTVGDVCINGVCEGVLILCDDGDPCTDDICDNGTCVFIPIPGCGQISYSQDVYPQVIDTDCTVCHAPPSNFGGLNLSNVGNDSYGTLVNQPSAECASYDFVEPGDSAASWLFRKIEGTHVEAAQAAGCSTAAAGSQMPIGGFCCLTPEQVQLVKDWIDQGAAP